MAVKSKALPERPDPARRPNRREPSVDVLSARAQSAATSAPPMGADIGRRDTLALARGVAQARKGAATAWARGDLTEVERWRRIAEDCENVLQPE